MKWLLVGSMKKQQNENRWVVGEGFCWARGSLLWEPIKFWQENHGFAGAWKYPHGPAGSYSPSGFGLCFCQYAHCYAAERAKFGPLAGTLPHHQLWLRNQVAVIGFVIDKKISLRQGRCVFVAFFASALPLSRTLASRYELDYKIGSRPVIQAKPAFERAVLLVKSSFGDCI